MRLKRLTLLSFFFSLTSSISTRAQQPELILPVGHTEDIYLTEYVADGKYILTCAYDNTAKLWETYSGKLLHTFPDLLHTPEHIVNSGNTTLLSSDRRYLVALTVDGYLKKWELPSAKLVYAVKAGNTNLVTMEYSKGGKYILFKRGWTHSEVNAEILDASNGRILHKFQEKSSNYNSKRSLGFSPDGKYILLQADSSLYLYTVPGRSLAFKQEQMENFNGAVFSPDGKYLVINPRRSNWLRLWRTNDGTLHELSASGTVEFSPDSRYILSKNDNRLTLSDVESGTFVHHFAENINEQMQGHFSSDGKHIFLSRGRAFIRGTDPYDSITHIWETSSGKLLLTLQGQHADINDVVISPDHKYATTISYPTQLWDMKTGKLIYTLEGRSALFSPDGKNMVVTDKRTVKIFNMRINDLLTELKGHSNPLVKAEFDPTGKLVLTLSNDSTVKIWDITRGRIIQTFEEGSVIKDAGFSRDGKKILLVTRSGKAVVKEISSGQTLLTLAEKGINTASFRTSDNHIVITADSTFLIIDAASGAQIVRRQEHYSMNMGALSNDGNYAYYIYGQSAVAVIELSTGRTFKNYLGEEDITRCQFSPDNRYIFILGAQATARIIETATGKQVEQFSERSRTEYGVTYMGGYYYQNLWKSDFDHFSPDGKWLLFRTYMDKYVVVRDMKDLSVADTVLTQNSLAKNAAFIPGSTQFVTGTADNKIRIWGKDKTGFRVVKEFSGNGFAISPDGKWLLVVNNVQLLFYDLKARQFRAKAIAINGNDYFIQLADKPYYAASKSALQTLLFRRADQYLSFEQFDMQLNRPDLVIAAMQNKDPLLIKAYRKAYEKRIKRSGGDTLSFKNGYNIPQAEFVNTEAISYEQETAALTVKIHTSDRLFTLDHFNIWVNEVPVYGRQGISIHKKKVKNFDTTVTIRISSGRNQLYTSVTNRAGIESYRVPLLVNYTPAVKPVETVYFIGIGIDKFLDGKHNLQYSSKDIRDLTARLNEKYKGRIVIDTLIDQNLTIQNVRSLKRKLLGSAENDKVIIAYSGHGLLNKDFDYYLSTYTTNFDKPEQNGIPYDELEDLLDNIPARKKLLLIDACHSGEVDKEEMDKYKIAEDLLKARGTKGGELRYTGKSQVGMKNSFELMQSLFVNVGKSTGATIISAAAGTQFALERGDLRNGVFTYSILEAMEKYPTMKISELKKIVGERVEQLTNGLQKPTSRNETIAVDWNLW